MCRTGASSKGQILYSGSNRASNMHICVTEFQEWHLEYNAGSITCMFVSVT